MTQFGKKNQWLKSNRGGGVFLNLTPDGFLLFFFGFCLVFFIFKLGQARLGKKISGLNRPFPKLSSRFFENSTAFFLKTAPPSFGKKLSTGFFPPTGPAKLPSGLTNGEGTISASPR